MLIAQLLSDKIELFFRQGKADVQYLLRHLGALFLRFQFRHKLSHVAAYLDIILDLWLVISVLLNWSLIVKETYRLVSYSESENLSMSIIDKTVRTVP